MKISAVIENSVVSGTILLDNLDPIVIMLKHKYDDAGVTKYLTLTSVTCQPLNTVFDYSFLNPHYFTSLYVDVNGNLQKVMESAEDEDTTSNPINDYVYTQNDIPEVTEILVVEDILDNVMRSNALSHSPAENLIDMEDISVTDHFIFTEAKRLRFDVTTVVKTVKTDVFELNHHTEITLALESSCAPSRARLILINHKGEERAVQMGAHYELLGRFCYSIPVVSSTKYARVEIDYDPVFDNLNSVYIDDIYVGKTAQYFEADNMDVRELVQEDIKFHPTTCFVFDFDRLPPFGLRMLLNVVDGNNGLTIQFSNSKVRIVKTINNSISQTIITSTVPNNKQIGVVISDVDIKIYSDNNIIKTTSFTTPISVNTHLVDIGATALEPDYDSNTAIKLSVSNKNSFE